MRDALLGQEPRDLDVLVADRALPLAETLPAALGLDLAPLRHDTVRMYIPNPGARRRLHVDLTSLYGGSLEDDLAVRDFTVNAMALPLARAHELLSAAWGERSTEAVFRAVIDPLGGLADLRARRLRLTSLTAFADDPGRVLRASRFLAALELTPSPELESAAREATTELTTLTSDRLREELHGVFAAPRAASGIAWLAKIGALAALVPAFALPAPPGALRPDQVLVAAVAALEPLRPYHALRPGVASGLAPLTHLSALRDWSAEPTRPAADEDSSRAVALAWGIFRYLATQAAGLPGSHLTGIARRIPGGSVGPIAATMVHRIPSASRLIAEGPALLSARRYFAEEIPGREERGVYALLAAAALAVGEAELRSNPSAAAPIVRSAAELLADYVAAPERYVPPPLVTGADLVREVPVAPGPAVGRALREVRQAQLEERITTREEALALARKFAAEIADQVTELSSTKSGPSDTGRDPTGPGASGATAS